uniref:MBD domain-containing protein n=1 Tax=Solanum lycopersicum TaxID=4081 RepID=A0A3Q7IVP5_SOLLC
MYHPHQTPPHPPECYPHQPPLVGGSYVTTSLPNPVKQAFKVFIYSDAQEITRKRLGVLTSLSSLSVINSVTHSPIYRVFETPKTSSRLATNLTVGIWVEKFEEIRSRFIEKPFNGNYKPNPSLPNTSSGFKRELYRMKYNSKMDSYYFTPTWKKLRSFIVVGTFFQQNPNIDDTIPSTALLANPNMKV